MSFDCWLQSCNLRLEYTSADSRLWESQHSLNGNPRTRLHFKGFKNFFAYCRNQKCCMSCMPLVLGMVACDSRNLRNHHSQIQPPWQEDLPNSKRLGWSQERNYPPHHPQSNTTLQNRMASWNQFWKVCFIFASFFKCWFSTNLLHFLHNFPKEAFHSA